MSTSAMKKICKRRGVYVQWMDYIYCWKNGITYNWNGNVWFAVTKWTQKDLELVLDTADWKRIHLPEGIPPCAPM